MIAASVGPNGKMPPEMSLSTSSAISLPPEAVSTSRAGGLKIVSLGYF
jgi:hypothetical protein